MFPNTNNTQPVNFGALNLKSAPAPTPAAPIKSSAPIDFKALNLQPKGQPFNPSAAYPTTPDGLKGLIVSKYPTAVASDGRKYTDIPAPELANMVAKKFPTGVTSDGRKYSDFLSPDSAPTPTPSAPSFSFTKDISGDGAIQKPTGFISSLFQSTLGSHGLAGAFQLPGRAIASALATKDSTSLVERASAIEDQGLAYMAQARKETDPQKRADLVSAAQQLLKSAGTLKTEADNLGKFNVTPSEALGTAANAALTAGTAGAPSAASKLGLSGTKALAATAAENAAIGVGYNTASNAIEGKPLTEGDVGAGIFGAAIPVAGAGVSKLKGAAQEGAKTTAERVINSLIKPLNRNFAYGKDPARGILAEKITTNSFGDFANKVSTRARQVGAQIGSTGAEVSRILQGKGKALDLTPALDPIDTAMEQAAKNNNPTLLHSLNNVKIALMHDLQLGTDNFGTPTILKGQPRDLTNASYDQAVQFLSDITAHTRFTGNPSDDAALNAATRAAYGKAREIMNQGAAEASPELRATMEKLNQRYGDLKSAELAINHRELVIKRQNILNLAQRFAIPVTIVGTILSGNWHEGGALLLAELASKSAGTTAVKSRVAQFLNAMGPNDRKSLLRATPILQNLLTRTIPAAKSATK